MTPVARTARISGSEYFYLAPGPGDGCRRRSTLCSEALANTVERQETYTFQLTVTRAGCATSAQRTAQQVFDPSPRCDESETQHQPREAKGDSTHA